MSSINGLILAGGKSQRMGTDKSLIDFHGIPQREYLHQLLKKVCSEVFVSHKVDTPIPLHLNPLADKFDIESPLNGILSAFTQEPHVAWLTVPVDMPNINLAAIHHLLLHRNAAKLATCFTDSEGQNPEPLFTLWEPAAFVHLKHYFETGGKGVKYFLLQHPVHIIAAPDITIHLNINSSEDLENYKKAT